MKPQLLRALTKIEQAPEDEAVRALAIELAERIDRYPDDLPKLAPALLRCLSEMGMTPRARAALVKPQTPGGDDRGRSPLDQLRQRRERRTGTD